MFGVCALDLTSLPRGSSKLLLLSFVNHIRLMLELFTSRPNDISNLFPNKLVLQLCHDCSFIYRVCAVLLHSQMIWQSLVQVSNILHVHVIQR